MTPYLVANTLLESRSSLPRVFGGTLFSDPAMSILLHLFVAEEEGRDLTITGCVEAASVPYTSVLRYIRIMESARLLKRRANPRDGRSSFIDLSADARLALRTWLAETGERIAREHPGSGARADTSFDGGGAPHRRMAS